MKTIDKRKMGVKMDAYFVHLEGQFSEISYFDDNLHIFCYLSHDLGVQMSINLWHL